MSAEPFTVTQPFEGVYHIRDALGVHMTLLAGDERALLFDTGYGLHDVRAEVRKITDLPLTVVLSHSHYDHVLGSRWFPDVLLCPEDAAGYRDSGKRAWRERVLRRLDAEGTPLSAAERESYLSFTLPTPEPLTAQTFDLGDLHARVWPMPGHTRGSVGLWVKERRLLLAGDNLNPVVWLFFADCTPLAEYTKTLQNVLYLPFAHALCPHADVPLTRRAVEDYVEGLRPETFRAAERVHIPPYGRIDTRECAPAEGFRLVFDAAKALVRESTG